MNGRFLLFTIGGYGLVWALAGYLAATCAVVGQPVDVRTVVACALLFSPFGVLCGALAWDINGQPRS